MKNEKMLDGIDHRVRLLEAFGDRPQDYEYNGEVSDLGDCIGKCACGHAIRYEYIWRHKVTNQAVVTGSVCVDYMPGLPNDSIERIKKHAEQARKELARKIREDKAKARRAAQETAVQEAIASFEESFRSGGYQEAINAAARSWVSEDIYDKACTGRWLRRQLESALKLKTARGQLDRIRQIQFPGRGL